MAEDFLPTELLPDALPPPPGNKRNRRMRSLQGQVGGGDKKKGKGSKKRDEFIALERSGAPPFLISKLFVSSGSSLSVLVVMGFAIALLV
jgi:hypothetical protein